VASRASYGGTSPDQVRAQAARWKQELGWCAEHWSWLRASRWLLWPPAGWKQSRHGQLPRVH